MTDIVERLTARTKRALPADWKKDRKCPECNANADRPKCMWDMGGACPRHDPDNYEPSPYVEKPDKDCHEAAALIASQAARIRELEENEAVIQWLRDPARGPSFYPTVKDLDDALAAVRARSLLSRKGGE